MSIYNGVRKRVVEGNMLNTVPTVLVDIVKEIIESGGNRERLLGKFEVFLIPDLNDIQRILEVHQELS